MNSGHIHYSPTARYSIGGRYERNRDFDSDYYGLQTNILLKRWNEEKSQANVYLMLSAGAQNIDGFSDRNAAGFVKLAADWEDRRYFFSYFARQSLSEGARQNMFHHGGRIGITPYIGDYGALHTWVMVQLDHYPDRDPIHGDELVATPLLRFFKGVFLGEIGYSSENELLLNAAIRF